VKDWMVEMARRAVILLLATVVTSLLVVLAAPVIGVAGVLVLMILCGVVGAAYLIEPLRGMAAGNR